MNFDAIFIIPCIVLLVLFTSVWFLLYKHFDECYKIIEDGGHASSDFSTISFKNKQGYQYGLKTPSISVSETVASGRKHIASALMSLVL